MSILHALGHLMPPAELERLGLPSSVAAEVAAAHHAAQDEAVSLADLPQHGSQLSASPVATQ